MRLFKKEKQTGEKVENLTQTVEADQEQFRTTLRIIQEMLQGTITAQVSVLNFAIDAIGRELEAETTARILYLHKIPDEQFRIPFDYPSQEIKEISLKDYNVIARPWDIRKMAGAARSVFQNGFQQKLDSINGILYPELKLAVIENGRHHTAAAWLKGTASADLTVMPLLSFFDQLTTDGAYWEFPGKGKLRGGEYRIAVLYELARRKWKLCLGDSFPEPPHKALTKEQKKRTVPEELFAVLCEQNDELFCLKHENEILSRHVEKLQAEIAELRKS